MRIIHGLAKVNSFITNVRIGVLGEKRCQMFPKTLYIHNYSLTPFMALVKGVMLSEV